MIDGRCELRPNEQSSVSTFWRPVCLSSYSGIAYFGLSLLGRGGRFYSRGWKAETTV